MDLWYLFENLFQNFFYNLFLEEFPVQVSGTLYHFLHASDLMACFRFLLLFVDAEREGSWQDSILDFLVFE